jgi:hypothetical protein
VGCEVFIAVRVKTVAFWAVTPYSPVDRYCHFTGKCYLHHQDASEWEMKQLKRNGGKFQEGILEEWPIRGQGCGRGETALL